MTALSLTITPSGFGRPEVAAFGIEYTIDGFRAGEVLLSMPSRITSVETMPPRDVAVCDVDGRVDVLMEEVPAADLRHWRAARTVTGPLTVRYTIPVRRVDENTRSAPLYDLRAEGDGLNGTGMTFLALPDFEGEAEISIRWDLSEAPSGTRAVTSWGEGQIDVYASRHDLVYAHFSVGPLHSHPAYGDPTLEWFGFYWTSEPTFDPVRIGEYTRTVYAAMAEFFAEPDPGFRVFARKHPYRGGGGCGLTRSFIFGYSETLPTSDTERESLIAHETVHTWLTLDGDQPSLSWYAEGLADYYATVLAHRSGLLDSDGLLARMNALLDLYYANPLQRLTFDRATELFWDDMRAQRVPYGRGLAYFLDLNGRLREAGGDLDSLVLEVLSRQRSGHAVGAAEWNTLVGSHLGGQVAARLHGDVLNGAVIRPHPLALGDAFTRVERTVPLIDIGFATASLAGDRIVRDLDPDSNAARAGLRDGDRIVDGLSFAELEAAPDRMMRLRVERSDAGLVDFEYHAVRGAVSGVAGVSSVP
jgi:predicted metalloprotease with PDZ domain